MSYDPPVFRPHAALSGETFPDYVAWVNAQAREIRREYGLDSASEREALALRLGALAPSAQQAAQRQLAEIARQRGLPNPAGFAATAFAQVRSDGRVAAERNAMARLPVDYANEIAIGPIRAKSSGPDPLTVFLTTIGLATAAAAIFVGARHVDRVLAASVQAGG